MLSIIETRPKRGYSIDMHCMIQKTVHDTIIWGYLGNFPALLNCNLFPNALHV